MKNKLKIIIPIVIAVITVIIAAVFIKFESAEVTDISSLVSTAQKYLIENNYEQAIAEFNKIIEIDPMNVDAYIGIAEAYNGMEDTERAVEWLEKGYALTGDLRLKNMIDEINSENIVETLMTTINTEITVSSDEIINETLATEEFAKIEEEFISFKVPYSIESTGNYLSDIYEKTYGNILIKGNNGSYNIMNKYIPEYYPNNIQDVTPSIYISKLNNQISSVFVTNYNTYKPSIILPTVRLDDIDGSNIYRIENEYNNKLQLIVQHHYNKNKEILNESYEYDYMGRVTSKKSKYLTNADEFEYLFYHSASMTFRKPQIFVDTNDIVTKYEYDANNNLIKASWNSGYFQYNYDENGNCIKEIYSYYSNANRLESETYDYEYYPSGTIFKITLSNSVIGEIEHIIFDTLGNVIEYKYYHGGGIRRFNEYGHIIEWEQMTYENKYDDSLRLIEVKEIYPEGSIKYYYFTYDTNGNLVETIESDELTKSRTICQYNSNNQIISKVEYYSSEFGNWIEKETDRIEYEYNPEGFISKSTRYKDGVVVDVKTCTDFINISLSKELLDEVLK